MDKNAKGSNKETITAATGHEPITDENGRMDLTKSGKAYQIFDDMHKKDPNVQRKDCLERAVKEADMTPASAATFYQKWRGDNGMVHHRDDDGSSGGQNNTQPVEIKTATVKNSGGNADDKKESPVKMPSPGRASKATAKKK